MPEKHSGHGTLKIVPQPWPKNSRTPSRQLPRDPSKAAGQDEVESARNQDSSLPQQPIHAKPQTEPHELKQNLPTTTRQDEVESVGGQGSSLPQQRLASPSRSSVVSDHRPSLSSSYNTRSAVQTHTTPTIVSHPAKNADINHSSKSADDDENLSIASSIDPYYYGFTTVLGNNLVQDLQEPDLAYSEEQLVTRLQEFSLRFGNENESANHLRMTSIVYRKPSKIAAQVCRGTYEEVGEGSVSISDASSLEGSSAANAGSRVDVAERDATIANWLGDLEVSTHTEYDETADANVQTAKTEDKEEEIISGHQKLIESEAYRWLVCVLRRSSRLNGIEPHCMSNCREVMMESLHMLTGRGSQGPKSHRLVTSKRPPPLFRARFSIPWDPLTFLQEECEGKSPGDVVGQVVTLSGDGRSVQAETCRGYLEQVWPTTGSDFVNLVVDLVTRIGQICKRILPDRTEISARLQDKTCVFEALGTQSSLGDLAEQILWVSSALRSTSMEAAGMTLCSAELVPTALELGSPIAEDSQTYHQRCLGTVDFRVAYKTSLPPDQPGPAEGDCWMQLFSSCCVVSGYPIPTRSPQRPGLELPLEIMASLIGADRVTPFGQDLIMKGYSDLFYATEHKDEYIMWHLICNETDPKLGVSRISFADVRIPRATDKTPSFLSIDDVLCMRHIVGWTSEVRSNAGVDDSRYYSSIISSDLGPPAQSWVLDKFQLTAGRYVTMTASVVRTKRQKSIVSGDDAYVRRVRDIGRRRFLLCDVDPGVRKVWMVNGLSVLLHLVRSHLIDAENDEISQKVVKLKAEQLKVVGQQNGPQLEVAYGTLTCRRNRELLLYHEPVPVPGQTGSSEKGRKDTECLEDLVKSLLHVLEQIVDHQEDTRDEEASLGCRIKRGPWHCLVGFDFMDVATLTRSIPPRATSLRGDAKAWVELTQELNAPTLFGKCFGEILEPATIDQPGSGCGVCHWNDTMPPERDILAAQVQDLLVPGKSKRYGNWLHFTHGQCLNISPAMFKPCTTECEDNDRIQRLQESSMNSQSAGFDETQSKTPSSIPPTAGVLLGLPHKSYWQPVRLLRNVLGGQRVQASASSPQRNSTTDGNSGPGNSGPGNSPAQSESTTLTNDTCSPQLLSNNSANLCSPELSNPVRQQISQDDVHRKKRAERRAEKGKYPCQV